MRLCNSKWPGKTRYLAKFGKFVLPKYVTGRASFEPNWDHELSPFFVMEIKDIVIIKQQRGNLHNKEMIQFMLPVGFR